MPNDREALEVIDDLHARLRDREREIERLRASVDDAQMTGIAIGVLLAHSPGWTEHDAIAAWNTACERLTRGGNTRALASYIVQTGTLPGQGVTAAL